MTIDTKISKSVKFEVGDWLTAPNVIFLRVCVVVDSGLGPMYGLTSAKHRDSIHWESQYEVDDQKLVKSEPEWEKFNKLKAGDILRQGHAEDRPYLTVLARVGDAVLLSEVPDKAKSDMLLKLDEYIKTVGGEFGVGHKGLGDQEISTIKKMGSQLHASKRAGDWLDIEFITLMNWELVEE